MVDPRDVNLLHSAARRILAFIVLGCASHNAFAQALTTAITGLVTDPSGALITQAAVTLHPEHGPDLTLKTGRDGRYTLQLPAGTQATILAEAEGFAIFVSGPLTLKPGRPLLLDIHLKIQAPPQQIDVSSDNADPSDPNRNADSIILKGSDIDQLPLTTSELQQELTALAGSPTPDLYVDGFSNGTTPPRDTIREIRINQNPYSSQNDTNPANGRIEIFTQPGTGSLHGSVFVRWNGSGLNSLNPFVTQEPPYHDTSFSGDLSGSITKRTSFFFNATQETDQSNAIIDAQILDPNLNQVPFSDAVSAPNTTYGLSGRIDTSLGAKSTIIARYSLDHDQQVNGGIGQFALASQGFTNTATTQTLQLSHSRILSKNIINDTRFQYVRSRIHQIPVSTAPSIVVEGAFTGGGNNGGLYHDNQDRFELQNYLSQAAGHHFLNYGARLRSTRDANASSANFNGTYIFSSLSAYQFNQQDLALHIPETQIAANGGGPSQFNWTAGKPSVAVSVTDAALFLQDDWRARQNLTLSAGLRFETQDRIHDHADWGPRLGAAWSILPGRNKQPRYTVRAAAGIFYYRFGSGTLLQAQRQNGINQQEYVINSPYAAQASAPISTVFSISPTYHAPYFVTSTLSLERRLGTHGSATFSYYHNRGSHLQVTRNINAPLPGTYNPADPASGVRPNHSTQNVYEYDSAALYRDTRLNTNLSLQFSRHTSLQGFYAYRRANTDDGRGDFASHQYDLRADYGPVPTAPRHQVNLVGGTDLPFGFRAFAFLRAASSLPFNIVLDYDFNGDSQFNDRPTFATDLTRPSVVLTRYGAFDTQPLAGQQTIPFDYGQGPGLFTVNLTMRKSFAFGPPAKLASGSLDPTNRRFYLELSADANNLLNHVNLSTPVGTLGSPIFGKSTALANGFSNTANRIIVLQSLFRF